MELLREGWVIWATAICVGFPLLAIALAQLAYAFQKRDHPLEKVLLAVANVFLPLLAIYIALTQILELETASSVAKVTLTFVLIAAIYLVLAFVNAIVFGAAKEDSWRAQTPRLLRDLIIILLVAIGVVTVLALVWERDVAGLFAALGVGSVILGFALQETIGNVMLGISLLMERPFTEGDWIEVGGHEGNVDEINWRAIRITNRAGDTVVIPHAIAAKEIILNNSEPSHIDRITVHLGFGYEHPPNQVKDMLMSVATSTVGIMADPAPQVQTTEYGDSSVNYLVNFWIEHPIQKMGVRDRFMTSVWYAAQRGGINIPFPIRTVFHHDADEKAAAKDTDALMASEDSHWLREVISAEDLDTYGKGAKLKHFARGETILTQNDAVPRLFLVLAGEADICVTKPGGKIHVVSELNIGDVFGEYTLLTGSPSLYEVRAEQDVEVLVFSAAIANRLVNSKPSLAVEIGQVMDRRRKAVLSAGT